MHALAQPHHVLSDELKPADIPPEVHPEARIRDLKADGTTSMLNGFPRVLMRRALP